MRPITFRGILASIAGAAAIALAVADLQLRTTPASDLDRNVDDTEHQIDLLKKATPEEGLHAQQHIASLKASLWTDARFKQLSDSLPKQWLVNELSPNSATTLASHQISFTRTSATFDDWSEIVTTIDTLARQPALTIRSITLTAAPRPARLFSRVLIVTTLAYPAPADPATLRQ